MSNSKIKYVQMCAIHTNNNEFSFYGYTVIIWIIILHVRMYNYIYANAFNIIYIIDLWISIYFVEMISLNTTTIFY